MLSCNGPLSNENSVAQLCILNFFFFFFCLQFGSPGGMQCPSSFVMCFCEMLRTASKLLLTVPQMTERKDAVHLPNEHLGTG